MKTGRKQLLLSLTLIPLIHQVIHSGKTFEHTQINVHQYLSSQQPGNEISVSVTGPVDLGPEFGDLDSRLSARVQLIVPMSLQMIDAASNSLASGWEAMDPVERHYFQLFFDPGNTGEIDQDFVEEVLRKYQKIRAEFDGTLTLVLEPESEYCVDERLFFTYYQNVHVCPYFMKDQHPRWMASVLVHELVHIALKVKDRAYYEPDSEAYESLTPRGSAVTQLPVIGPLFREVLRGDTLYHPDAYAWFGAMILRDAQANAAIQDMEVTIEGQLAQELTGSINSGR